MDGGKYTNRHTVYLDDDVELSALVTWEYTPDYDDEEGGWTIDEVVIDSDTFEEALTEQQARGIWRAVFLDGPDFSTMKKVEPDLDFDFGDQRL